MRVVAGSPASHIVPARPDTRAKPSRSRRRPQAGIPLLLIAQQPFLGDEQQSAGRSPRCCPFQDEASPRRRGSGSMSGGGRWPSRLRGRRRLAPVVVLRPGVEPPVDQETPPASSNTRSGALSRSQTRSVAWRSSPRRSRWTPTVSSTSHAAGTNSSTHRMSTGSTPPDAGESAKTQGIEAENARPVLLVVGRRQSKWRWGSHSAGMQRRRFF